MLCPGRSAAASGRALAQDTQTSLRSLRKLDCVVVRCRPGTARSSVPAAPGLGVCGGPGSAVHHDAHTNLCNPRMLDACASCCTASGTQTESPAPQRRPLLVHEGARTAHSFSVEWIRRSAATSASGFPLWRLTIGLLSAPR